MSDGYIKKPREWTLRPCSPYPKDQGTCYWEVIGEQPRSHDPDVHVREVVPGTDRRLEFVDWLDSFTRTRGYPTGSEWQVIEAKLREAVSPDVSGAK